MFRQYAFIVSFSADFLQMNGMYACSFVNPRLLIIFVTATNFSNDFIDQLTKCTIRYTTQAEA